MKIKSQTSKKTTLPKVAIEFDTDFEKNKFIDYVNELVFDGIYFGKKLDKDKISGVYSDLIIEKNLICFIGAAQGEPFALWWDIKDIKTDPNRFQNRQSAFSELSAEQVEKNFDSNKFDPIVVWGDANSNNQIYVLSGHSRYEGMKRRKEKYIPVRFFEGDENKAIAFARIDANRVANKEDLISDLKAYILARDGDVKKNIQPYEKKDLQQAFKGKENKLEAWSFLNPNGLYIEKMSDEDTISQYPKIQSFASWVGQLRKDHPNMTNTHEKDTFLYFYRNADNYKITREDFDKLVKERLAMGKERIFPECSDEGCEDIKDFKEVGQNRELYKELNRLQTELETFKKRFETNSAALKIYTEPEKKILTAKALQKEKELKNLQRDLKKAEDQPGLFGPSDIVFEDVNFLIYYCLPGDRKRKKFFSFFSTQAEAKKEFKELFKNKKVSIKKVLKL